MDDLLEKMICENKNAFEEDAPEGHFERFEQRLKKQQQPPAGNHKKKYLQIAAAAAFVLLLGNQLRMYLQQAVVQPETYGFSLSSISPEYGEVEYYYTSTWDKSMSHWQKLVANGLISTEEQQLLKDEMNEFDQTYQKLQQELKSKPDDERIINAMLELYQTRLAIINLIIEKLENLKKEKETKYENEI
ncbi:MAG: hypothetical protein ACK5JD_06775 [Mangrovibacterium sp.]